MSVVAVLLLAGFIARAAYGRVMSHRLLQTPTAAVLGKSALMRFADSFARPIYQARCAGCHGERLLGNSARGAPNLVDDDWLFGDGSVMQIEHTILYGIRSGNPKSHDIAYMPAFGRSVPYGRYGLAPLTPPEIHETVEYLRSLAARTYDSTAASRGAKVFATNGACYDCHSADGLGEPEIGAPNLTDTIWLYGNGSRESVFDSIAYGRHGSCPAWNQVLSSVQIRALAIYIGSRRQHQ